MSLALKGFKLKVVEKCLDSVQVKLSQLEVEKSKIQDSANNETKSSMGDKYETGRAMAQNEIGKLELNILDCKNQLAVLNKIKFDSQTHAFLGSIVKLDSDFFLISVPIGLIVIDNIQIYCISTSSPLGKLIIGKSKGDEIVINGLKRILIEVINE